MIQDLTYYDEEVFGPLETEPESPTILFLAWVVRVALMIYVLPAVLLVLVLGGLAASAQVVGRAVRFVFTRKTIAPPVPARGPLPPPSPHAKAKGQRVKDGVMTRG